MGVAVSAECYRYPFISPSLLRSSSPRLCLETVYPVKAQQEIGACFHWKPRGINTWVTCPCVHSYPHLLAALYLTRSPCTPYCAEEVTCTRLGDRILDCSEDSGPLAPAWHSYQHFHPKLLEQLSNNCQRLSNTWPLQCLWLPSTYTAWDSYKGGGVSCCHLHMRPMSFPSFA